MSWSPCLTGRTQPVQALIDAEAAKDPDLKATARPYPGAMFVVDIKREHNAVAEARRLKIPVVAIVDTNCDPDLVEFPVAGNDDAIRSVRMILATLGQVITHAQAEYEAKYARRKTAEEAAAEPPTTPAVAAVPAPVELIETLPAAVPQAPAGI